MSRYLVIFDRMIIPLYLVRSSPGHFRIRYKSINTHKLLGVITIINQFPVITIDSCYKPSPVMGGTILAVVAWGPWVPFEHSGSCKFPEPMLRTDYPMTNDLTFEI